MTKCILAGIEEVCSFDKLVTGENILHQISFSCTCVDTCMSSISSFLKVCVFFFFESVNGVKPHLSQNQSVKSKSGNMLFPCQHGSLLTPFVELHNFQKHIPPRLKQILNLNELMARCCNS